MRCIHAGGSIFAAALALALAAAVAPAQIVRGDVTDAVTHAPIFGAIVLVFDTAGTRIAGAMSDDSGHFSVRLRAAGAYRLRAERIGYASTPYDTIVIETGASLVAHLSATSVAVVLPTVMVSGSGKCVIRPEDGAETAALWTEARKALYGTQVAIEGHLVFAVRKRYTRILDGMSLNVTKERVLIDSVMIEHPWESNVSPEDLAKSGYAVTYQGDPVPGFLEPGDPVLVVPDADILLSDAFARTHCFKLRHDRGDKEHAGLIGLTFEPAIKRSAPDVTGTIWLDSATAALRYMEFRHTNMFAQVSPRHYGGKMVFEQLPGGVWVVRSWSVRLPVTTSSGTNAAGMGDTRFMGGVPHVAFYNDDGGELITANVVGMPPNAAPIAKPPSATP